MFSGLSALSAYSLIVFGGISLLISAFSGSLVGIAISLAMLAHGFYERRCRQHFLNTKNLPWLNRMAVNQLALAVSLSLYAAAQIFLLEEDEIKKILLKDSVKPIFSQLDPALQIDLMNGLPMLVTIVYLCVIVLAWVGCSATALYYMKAGKSSLRTTPSSEVEG